MNLYKIKRIDTWGYDEYDSAVVVASTPTEARSIRPDGGAYPYSWPKDPNLIKVTLLGKAVAFFDKPQVIVASFNAG